MYVIPNRTWEAWLIFCNQAEEWLYFHKGQARASAFIGNGAARTFDFSAGDTAVFPTNSGYVPL